MPARSFGWPMSSCNAARAGSCNAPINFSRRNNMFKKTFICFLFALGFSAAAPIQIRLATGAPRGTSLHQAVQEMRQRWIEATNGQVVLTIYTDGVMGGEAEVVRRMRIGQLQAGMLTVVGLSEIDRSVTAL